MLNTIITTIQVWVNANFTWLFMLSLGILWASLTLRFDKH